MRLYLYLNITARDCTDRNVILESMTLIQRLVTHIGPVVDTVSSTYLSNNIHTFNRTQSTKVGTLRLFCERWQMSR